MHIAGLPSISLSRIAFHHASRILQPSSAIPSQMGMVAQKGGCNEKKDKGDDIVMQYCEDVPRGKGVRQAIT